MSRIQDDLLQRSFRFAIEILAVADRFPHNPKGWVLAKQLLRSSTSVGTCIRDQAVSKADFSHKCSIARKEAAETKYWLELSVASEVLVKEPVEILIAGPINYSAF